MYTTTNFKTKKALKEAIAAGKTIQVFQPNDYFNNPKAAPDYSGQAAVEGPHYPEPHRWYATVQIKDGVIITIK